jgi:hypothetical protein
MAYDINADYQYICESLSALISSVGGDETAAHSIDYIDLKKLIGSSYGDVGTGDPSAWSASQRATYRKRQRKYDNARKFVFQRDLLKVRLG